LTGLSVYFESVRMWVLTYLRLSQTLSILEMGLGHSFVSISSSGSFGDHRDSLVRLVLIGRRVIVILGLIRRSEVSAFLHV